MSVSRQDKIRCRLVAVVALLIACAFVANANTAPHRVVEALQSAETAYIDGRSDEAITLYRQVLDAGWSSADLYYNLGCACYKAGEIGWAVAYLEEARRLAPRDGDIRYNLKVASARSRDLLTDEQPSTLLGLLTEFLDGFTTGDMIRLLLVCLWAGVIGLCLWWLSRGRLRQVARGLLVGVLTLVILSSSGFLLKLYQQSSAPSGVVVATESQVLAGPREGETVQFVLHAGTLLHLGRDAGGWREIWLNDDMRGWIRSDNVTALGSPAWLR
jgi:tetratricopeptide (TPR) repeat protein